MDRTRLLQAFTVLLLAATVVFGTGVAVERSSNTHVETPAAPHQEADESDDGHQRRTRANRTITETAED